MSDNQINETMEDYKEELEASFHKMKEGDIISGTVVSVSEEEVILDLRYYTQGVILAQDMSDDPDFHILERVAVGDEMQAAVMSMDDGSGNIRLSRKEANAALAWERIKEMLEREENLSVRIKQAVKGGAVAYIEGIRAFIPASQLSLSYVEDIGAWVGRTVTARVIEADAEKGRVILSSKVVEKELAKEEHDHKISMIVPGSVLEGTVESLMPYGAFVSLQDGLSGLVHISQICSRRISKPSEVLKEGDKVKVKVLGAKDGKISLSMKAVQEDSGVDSIDEAAGYDYHSEGEATTSLGDLFAKLKL